MSPSKTFAAPLPSGGSVHVAIVTLADGRVVARTADEVERLPLEDQAAIATAYGLPTPAPGRA